MKRITKQLLADRLSAAIHFNAGIQGLDTLIYGWLKHRRYGHTYRDKLYHRDWMYLTEVHDLSLYAGYDLLTGERLPDR